jgi:hypothetical protein
MKLLTSSTLLSICTYALLTHALPLSDLRNEHQIARRKAPYSVVPVDGGQPSGNAPPKTEIVTKDSTQTVTEPPKTLPPVTETRLSTSVVTLSETPTTIITTITTTSTPITTQAPTTEVSPYISTTLLTVTSLVSAAGTLTITSTPTLTAYDDGKWHTTYYKAAEPSSPLEISSSAAGHYDPSSTSDVESATHTDMPSNGTYALMLRGKNQPQPSGTITNGTNTTRTILTPIKPPMPTLPTSTEYINPTEVPWIDVAKHMVPAFGR